MLHSKYIFEDSQFCLQAYQYYLGSGENATLGKCGPGGGSGILQGSVASGGSGGVVVGEQQVDGAGWAGGATNKKSSEEKMPQRCNELLDM